ncbi:MAG: hypothetical protein IKA02_01565, partial [Clostridia bacterium]|nr:hypothetical protein [Clostridia bacterium]
DNATGDIIPLSRGIVLDVTINGVLKGQIGKAGELKGIFNAKKIGVLNENSTCGVFGYLSDTIKSPENKMKLCPKEEVMREKHIFGVLYQMKNLKNIPFRYPISTQIKET